ncbi:MAG: lipoyl(octanoyl) transferase LipB [Candidatus Omnitrophica bacterium]|nr:lipoyl(octanoyl) transferase LipB [Candidatus Omnitrophota bacterium]
MEIINLDLIDYQDAYQIQRERLSQIKKGKQKECIFLCRHYPVITVGRKGSFLNIKVTREFLNHKKIKIIETDRGGDVTYHGPGQIMIYPIVFLRRFSNNLHTYFRLLEEIALKTLCDFKINANRREGLTGVWVGIQKICSIGIKVSSGISMHGLAINVKDNDLENFSLIRPCGLDIKMTSIETEIKEKVNFEDIFFSLKRSINLCVL